MQRTYLKHGDTIELNNKMYTVKSVIGDGATCVVYSAEYKDINGYPHRVNIKECYPYNATITREGVILKWDNNDDKEKHLQAFDITYKKLNEWQEGIANVSVYDICDKNNTKYIIMEHNKNCVTFDKDTPETLCDILKTIKLLAHYVGKYHQSGYLHLDIKPSNFLVYPRPSGHIVLFDLDTVASISDIETGKYRYISYSDGWAAPEQKQGKINKLCPATDIYAIGAVLFEKIMGRQVINDDIGCFAEWSFDGEFFEDVNPKIKRLLTNIFKKTLAANIKRRYQTADALIKDLNEAESVAASEVYLKGNDICCSSIFIGREDELKQIKDCFYSKKKAVFLHGFGGIGKTEIARKYAELYKNDYDVVLFIKYDNNSTLQEKLDEIEIVNFDGDVADHRKKLRSLLDDKTLVIIDNFDVEIGADNGLKSLFDTKAQILVSTRTDFSSVYSGDKYTQIEITELAINELEQVFFNNARIENLTDSDKEILYEIFKLIENHTYATELLAKQMYYSGLSLENLYNKVKLGFAAFADAEKVVTNKDDDNKKDKTLNILRAIYRIADLTDGQKQVLRNLFLLRFLYITKEIYNDYALSNIEDFDDINTLIEIGLIKYDRIYYSLHPLVEDMIACDLKPNEDNCKWIYSIVNMKITNTSFYVGCDDADEYEFEANCDYLCAFFKSIDLMHPYNKSLLINWLLNMIENEDTYIGHIDDIRFAALYDKLFLLSQSEKVTAIEKYNIYYILLQSWILGFDRFYMYDPDSTESYHETVEWKIREILILLILCCESIDNEKQECIDKISNTFIEPLLERMMLSDYKPTTDILDIIFSTYPMVRDKLTATEKLKLGLSLSESELTEWEKEEQSHENVAKSNCMDEEIELEMSVKKNFLDSKDKIAYFKSIINDKKYDPIKRAELLWYCTDSVFGRLHLGWPVKNIENYDWKTLEEVLDIEEDFLISDECKANNLEEHQNWCYYLDNNNVNQAIVYAATNNSQWFEDSINIILKDIERDIKLHLERGYDWRHFIVIRRHMFFSIEKIKNSLELIKKVHMIIPVLIRILQGWQQYAEKINKYDERDFFSLYKVIAECAESASIEEIINPEYDKDFCAMEFYYRNKMDSIAGIDYLLKIEN